MAESTAGSSNSAGGETTPSVVKLNLSTASAGDLLTVPGVGNRMGRKFEEMG